MTISERALLRVVMLAVVLSPVLAWGLPPALENAPLPDAERARLEARAERLATLTAAQKSALLARVEAWRALPPAERVRRRAAYTAAAALPASEQARLEAAARYFAGLPGEARAALRLEFDQLDEGLRRGWLLGPEIGGDWPALHALFSAMPEDAHQDALAALRLMSAQARADLAALIQRTPPQERETLRRQWLAQPPTSRDAWVRARVNASP